MRPQRGVLPLGGMNRNKATMPGDPQPQPDEVFNLRPHRSGGLMSVGKVFSSGLFVEPSSFTILGGDASGTLSFDTGTVMRLVAPVLDGASIVGVNASDTSVASRDLAMHLPGLGPQLTYSEYLYLTPNGSVGNSDAYFEASGLFLNQINTGGDLPEAIWGVMALVAHETRTGMRVIRRARAETIPTLSSTSQITIQVGALEATDLCDIYVAQLTIVGGEGSWGQWRYFDTVTAANNNTTLTHLGQLRGSIFPTTSGFGSWAVTHSVTAAAHNRRIWSVQDPSPDSTRVVGFVEHATGVMPTEPDPALVGGPLTLHYTETGYVNLADPGSTLPIPAQASEKVTALVSSPSNEFGVFGGLLVFCDNETFVVVGDPAIFESYALQPHALPLGCDEGVRPAQIGGLIFVVWQGRLYLIEGAQSREISRPVIRPGEAFTQVVTDVETESVIALHSDGRWYRYYYLHDFWCIDPLSNEADAADLFGWGGAHPVGPFFTNLDDTRVVASSSLLEDPPYLTWLDVDFGDPAMHKKLFQARTFASSYDGGATLAYNMHSGMDEVDESTATTLTSTWDEGDGLFRFPPGVRGKRLDFKLSLPDLPEEAVLETPVEVTFTPGYRKR